jgi:hypothetical protein
VDHPGVDAWKAWHPNQMAERLNGLQFPWRVAAGRAVDLFRGEQTRVIIRGEPG